MQPHAIRHNHVAIVVAVVLNMVVGGLWYSPFLFQNMWLTGWGKRAEDVNTADPIPLVLGVVMAFVSAYIFSWLVQRADMQTATGGALLAMLLWAAAAAPGLVPHYAIAGVPWSVTSIDAINALVCSVIAGVVIGGWRKKG
jgi:hypothetical protein